MSLVEAGSTPNAGSLRAVVEGLLGELRERRAALDGYPPLAPAIESRRRTVRDLVEDALEFAESRPLPALDARELARMANLLYDVDLVAAEYTKLFFRDPSRAAPTPPVRLPTSGG